MERIFTEWYKEFALKFVTLKITSFAMKMYDSFVLWGMPPPNLVYALGGGYSVAGTNLSLFTFGFIQKKNNLHVSVYGNNIKF